MLSKTGGRSCDSYSTCSTRMQELQSHQVNKGIIDIIWNFVIGGDGNVYVGRNWNYTVHQNSSLAIGIMGLKSFNASSFKVQEAILELIVYGVIIKEIDHNYQLLGDDFNVISNSSIIQNPNKL